MLSFCTAAQIFSCPARAPTFLCVSAVRRSRVAGRARVGACPWGALGWARRLLGCSFVGASPRISSLQKIKSADTTHAPCAGACDVSADFIFSVAC